MTENFSVSIKAAGAEVTITGDSAFISEWYTKLKQEVLGESGVHAVQPTKVVDAHSATVVARISLPELLRKSSSKTMSETIMVFVYFMEKYENLTGVNTADVSAAFVRAKRPSPKNITNQVNQLIAQGLLFEEPDKKNSLKTVSLTDTGLEHVEKKLLA